MAENTTLLVLGVVLVVLITAGLTYYITKSNVSPLPPVINQTNGSSQPPTITVTGEATKTLMPDLMTIGITIESLGSNTSASEAQNAIDTASVKAALLAADVNESEIQTESYYTYPVYDESCRNNCPNYPYDGGAVPVDAGAANQAPSAYSKCIDNSEGGVTYGCAGLADAMGQNVAQLDIAPPAPIPYPCKNECNITGYKTVHMIMVKTDRTKDGGKIIDAALKAADGAKIGYVYFSIKDETRISVDSELQAEAATAAKTKADNIAKGLGAKVGKIVSINPNYYYPSPIYAYDARSANSGSAPSVSPPTEIFPTDTTMSSSITVVYELVQ